jgi:hypothetical protein
VTRMEDSDPGTARHRLWTCWIRLDDLVRQSRTDYDQARQAQTALAETHRAALDDLVALDEMDAKVAEHVQAAFVEASFHTWRDSAPITCYRGVFVARGPSEDLLLQADKLTEVSGDLDPATVAAVQAALARDMAFFGALSEDTVEARSIASLWSSGEIEVCREAFEAAQFLVDLLLEEPI